ncbi:DUF4232 domain-containing protein [Streptomyces sp. SID4946]|uniref:DUF4232 domain-containing protein n=1 Tax=Streptomyces sp. LamerLS-31b TaxID=1839765 RepID=UPI00081F2EC4|nr:MULTISPECIES: DUF4232 domain-containing protein [unclassified Streptomyces]MYQ90089.1 DUF4232 domain-containing protein [Streptomyces sp. SID4946]SCF58390.1 Protein of unknown function [Streptomyces sp. DconLS]SCF96114.1 Protein of unknown function [Streptomyces sp. LamerLS-31b]
MNTLHRTALLAAAGTALVLSLTACQGDGDANSAPTSGSSVNAQSPSGKATDASGTTGSANSAGSSSTSGSTGSNSGGGSTKTSGSSGSFGSASSGEQASASTPVCAAGDVRITAATQDGPPYTHIVLTAKNTSRHSCRLTGFPHIQFLESHKQDVPAVAKSKPEAPVVLAAGDPAYALVKLSDGGREENNEPVTAFSVMLAGDPTVIAVTAPGSEGIAVDPAKALTGYWTPELRNGADDF